MCAQIAEHWWNFLAGRQRAPQIGNTGCDVTGPPVNRPARRIPTVWSDVMTARKKNRSLREHLRGAGLDPQLTPGSNSSERLTPCRVRRSPRSSAPHGETAAAPRALNILKRKGAFIFSGMTHSGIDGGVSAFHGASVRRVVIRPTGPRPNVASRIAISHVTRFSLRRCPLRAVGPKERPPVGPLRGPGRLMTRGA